jgi:hypothetical protein
MISAVSPPGPVLRSTAPSLQINRIHDEVKGQMKRGTGVCAESWDGLISTGICVRTGRSCSKWLRRCAGGVRTTRAGGCPCTPRSGTVGLPSSTSRAVGSPCWPTRTTPPARSCLCTAARSTTFRSYARSWSASDAYSAHDRTRRSSCRPTGSGARPASSG